jgi:hypothetical protein
MLEEEKKIGLSYYCNRYKDTVPTPDYVYKFPGLEKVRATTYNSFDSIKGGYITYHLDKRNIKDVYSNPVFSNKSLIRSSSYVDPMGSLKPQYIRIETKISNPDSLTFLKDTNSQREEIIALQMRKRNQQMYEPIWKIY